MSWFRSNNVTINKIIRSESTKLPASPREQEETGLATIPRPKLGEPSFYKVILLNDDYTPMDFVVAILQNIFHRTPPDAQKIMLQVHQQGAGVAGIYTLEIAETKIQQVHDFARQNKYPLRCTIEKEHAGSET